MTVFSGNPSAFNGKYQSAKKQTIEHVLKKITHDSSVSISQKIHETD